MKTLETRLGRVIVIRLDTGEDMLTVLRQAVADHGIKSGVFLGAIGSVSRYRIHVVSTTELPPVDVFPEGEAALDILSVTGQVMDGRVHAHIGFSGTDATFGGHLEEGCRVLTFSCVWLAETPDANITDWDRMGSLA